VKCNQNSRSTESLLSEFAPTGQCVLLEESFYYPAGSLLFINFPNIGNSASYE